MRPVIARHLVAVAVGAWSAGACRDAGVGPGGASAPVTLAWHTQTATAGGGFWLGRPAVDAGRVFVQGGNSVFGLDAGTGAVLWSRPVRVAPSPPPTVLLARDGRVYLSEVDSVMAMEAGTGRTVWTFHPDSQAVVEPALDATTLYTGQRGIPVVYALNSADGTLRWRTNIGIGYQFLAYVTGVAVSGDTVYAAVRRDLVRTGFPAGTALVALDRGTGHELWRYETPVSGTILSPVDSGTHGSLNAPVVAGRLVVITDFLGKSVFAVDPGTQRVAWRFTIAANGPSRVVLDAGTLFVAGEDGAAYALDARTGALRWTAGGFGSLGGGAYCHGAFFVNDQRLQRLDAASGKTTGSFSTGSNAVFTSDLIGDDARVYLTGIGGAYAVACP